jgi:tRNA pseudouridine synthase 10
LDEEEITKRINSLSGQTLEQQTPQRVAHRRADKVRKRKVMSIDNIQVVDHEIEFDVRCESGTYVKELVHSDEGRTNPSVAGVLEADCEVIWLDVKDIHAD